jgi:PAS domain S-box-containing protein
MELKFSGSIQDLPASDRLGLLVDSVTDYAIYLLDRDGVIRTWNTGAERIKGYRAAEAIGQHLSLFFTPEDKAADVPAQILARAGWAGRAEHEVGVCVRTAAGSGRRPWSSRCVMPEAAPSALPKSPATSPSGRWRSRRCGKPPASSRP